MAADFSHLLSVDKIKHKYEKTAKDISAIYQQQKCLCQQGKLGKHGHFQKKNSVWNGCKRRAIQTSTPPKEIFSLELFNIDNYCLNLSKNSQIN